VTGGAGFIGSHLVDALLERGARVRVLDDLSTGRRENLAHAAGRVELLEDDVRDPEACRRARAGVWVVFHQPARDAEVRRMVYASSSSVYGDSPALPKREGEEGRPLPPLRPLEGDGRGAREPLRELLRARDRRPAPLQRLRPAPGPQRPLRRGLELYLGAGGRRPGTR
jgi:nucleoside-diphosphate-sugar epimerase